jgi:hypothetical protein
VVLETAENSLNALAKYTIEHNTIQYYVALKRLILSCWELIPQEPQSSAYLQSRGADYLSFRLSLQGSLHSELPGKEIVFLLDTE